MLMAVPSIDHIPGAQLPADNPCWSKKLTRSMQSRFRLDAITMLSIYTIVRWSPVIWEKSCRTPDHAQCFHYQLFALFWQPPTDMPIRKYECMGELFTSPAFLDTYHEVQEMLGEPGCGLERVVVALMFWSDATHLTNFGTAKLWPCCLFFGNESKYCRCKPTCHLCSHVACFQAVRGYLSVFFSFFINSLYSFPISLKTSLPET